MKKPLPFGKYLLLDRIAIGGMAEVFVAVVPGDEAPGKLYAVKRILPSLAEDSAFLTMFLDEARITAQLNHAAIVPVYELGKQSESYYIAMEYVPGQNLHAVLARQRSQGELLPIPITAYIASRLCDALDYAHRKHDAAGRPLHVVHRDVSPQNVLLSYDGEVRIIDFGIAQATTRAGASQPEVLRGKFSYMSPEQVLGLPVDRRSDVFAVGAMLYEMLTGRKLFAAGSDLAVLEKVRNAEVRPPSRFNPAVPRTLDSIVLHALAREVPERTAWASELRDALEPFVLGVGASSVARLMAFLFAVELQQELTRAKRLSHSADLMRVERNLPAPSVDETGAHEGPVLRASPRGELD